MKEENILFVSLIAAESGELISLFTEKVSDRLETCSSVSLGSIENLHVTVGAAVAKWWISDWEVSVRAPAGVIVLRSFYPHIASPVFLIRQWSQAKNLTAFTTWPIYYPDKVTEDV